MKLTIKTLTQAIFKVDIEPDKTVKDLKETIEREQGKEYPYGSQKLIYNGKILADESKLAEYEFDEKKFVVLMITRQPPAPKPVAPASSSSTEQATSKSSEERKPQTARRTNPSSMSSSSSSATPTTATTTATTVSSTLSATANTTTTSNATQARQIQPPSSGRNSALNDLAALSMGEPQMAARLAAMMSQPQFRQMQDLIQQNPHLLSATIESIATTDPEMYMFISDHPDVFISALNHPPMPLSRPGGVPSTGPRQSSQPRGSSQQAVGVQGGGGPQPMMDQLLGDGVSEHDKEAIERLKELGFPELMAVQAYMACDKDEQLAANLLFQMDQ